MPELLIVGSGAMALLFGSRFAAAGLNPAFLGTWPEGIQALGRDGIRLMRQDGEQRFPVRAFQDPSQIRSCQLALVLVKSWQTERAARQLKDLLRPDGLALTLQNGLGNLEILAGILGESRVAQGVTTYGATLLGPGRVRPGGEGLVSLPESSRLVGAVEFFQRAGIAVQQVPDLRGLIWGKLVINAAINPLTALLGVLNGRLLESGSAREIMGQAAGEAARVAQAQGIRLDFDDPALAAEAVARATAENKSSMLQDIERGAPTEIDVLCGAVVEAGRAAQVPTPVNRFLWKLVRARVELEEN